MRLVEGGVLICMASCYGCRGLFMFDPELVPVVGVNGMWEPLCQHCVALANPIRIAHGQLPIVPMPGAYVDV